MSLKNLIKTRTYRERSQPVVRQHLGLLEKHKDYVLRARDFHRKEDALQKLREKAAFRNPDEYYMKMAHTKTEGGVHQKRSAEQPTADDMKRFKKEDANYLMVKQTAEARKIERLRANLHMLDAPLQNKHTIFVADRAQGRELDASRHGTTAVEAASAPPVRPKKGGKERSPGAAPPALKGDSDSDAALGDDGGDDDWGGESARVAAGGLDALPSKRRAKLERAKAAAYSELEQRQARHAQMGAALQRIGIEKALMGKGARKKLKSRADDAPKTFKWKQRRKK